MVEELDKKTDLEYIRYEGAGGGANNLIKIFRYKMFYIDIIWLRRWCRLENKTAEFLLVEELWNFLLIRRGPGAPARLRPVHILQQGSDPTF